MLSLHIYNRVFVSYDLAQGQPSRSSSRIALALTLLWLRALRSPDDPRRRHPHMGAWAHRRSLLPHARPLAPVPRAPHASRDLPRRGPLHPEEPTLANFAQVLTDGAFPRYLWNGLKLSCAGAALAVLLATPAAWAFSRHPSRTGDRLLLAILALQMVSPLVLMLPLYRWFDRLGLLDTHTAVILVLSALGIPLSTWLIKLGFDAIPRALSDAAAIDGAGPFATFWKSACRSPCHPSLARSCSA